MAQHLPPLPACCKYMRTLPWGCHCQIQTNVHPLRQPRNASLISVFQLVIQRSGKERRGQDHSDSFESRSPASSSRARAAGSIVCLGSFAWGSEAGFVHSKHRGATGARQQWPAAGLACATEGPPTRGCRRGRRHHLEKTGLVVTPGELFHVVLSSLSLAEGPPVAGACGKQETGSHFRSFL